jgi:hypothetical protein
MNNFFYFSFKIKIVSKTKKSVKLVNGNKYLMEMSR